MKRYDFNKNWIFSDEKISGRMLTLPHDAMLETKRVPDAPGGSACAYFQGGTYSYSKTFTTPAEWIGKHLTLEFEGVYKNAKVYINGNEAGGCQYGYLTFYADCGILSQEENTILVTCENKNQPDSRWYTGAGIYRPVWAWVGEGIMEKDIQVTTKSIVPAVIHVHVSKNVDVPEAEIYDNETLVAKGYGDIEIPNAKLWDAQHPHLYRCKINDAEVTFGIRQITWNNNGLFINGENTLLRGGCIHHDHGILGAACYRESEFRKVRILKESGFNAIRSAHNPCSRDLLDACDFYGMYVINEAWDMWYHHKSAYDYASDWKENYVKDLEKIVSHDYNHPSVIMYSIGNEVSEPAQAEGIKYTKEMVQKLHDLDCSRPVTAGFNLMIIANSKKGKGIYDEEKGGRKNDSEDSFGKMNSTMFNLITSFVGSGMNKAANSKRADEATTPSLDVLDIAGYNYASGRYPMEGKKHPDRIIFGSETFPQDIAKNWKMVEQYPYLIGDFMWTAWDYLGEAGIGAWGYTKDAKGFNKPYPWLLGDTGVIDILGNPNGELFLAKAAWNLLKTPVISVQPANHPGTKPIKGAWRGTNSLPSWSWRGCEGNKAFVEVYFDCDHIKLLLNNKVIGQKRVKDYKAVFKTTYHPGELLAIAYDENGIETGRAALSSASDASVHISPEKSEVTPGEILYIPITIGDRNRVESNADQVVTVSVENGELLAFGSANPRTEESYLTGSFTTYYGHSLAVVRCGDLGEMVIHANDTVKTIKIVKPFKV